MYFDGTGDGVYVADHPSFDVGSGDFTVEFWVYISSMANNSFKIIYHKRLANTTDSTYMCLALLKPFFANPSLRFFASSNNTSWDIVDNFSFGLSPASNTWHHVAIVRNGTEIAGYLNGVKGSNTITTSASIANTTLPFYIADDPNLDYDFAGYIDDFRFTKGTARYTSNFTPPTAAFPDP